MGRARHFQIEQEGHPASIKSRRSENACDAWRLMDNSETGLCRR